MAHERCPERDLVDRHFRGRISPEKEQHMREHLPSCADCRARYERHLLNSQLAGGLEPADRLAIGLGLPRAPAATTRWASASWSMFSVAAAVAVMFLLSDRWRDRADERMDQAFAARGGASTSDPAVQPSLQVFRVTATGSQVPVGGAIQAAEELAFAYRNPTGFRWLAVVGTDESGHIYWYHPAPRDPKDDPAAVSPAAVSIEKSDFRELPAAIRQAYQGSRLRIVALFSNQPVSAETIEQLVRKGDLAPAELGELQAVEKTLEIRR